MPHPLARLVCRIAGHEPSKSFAIALGLDHPRCDRCGAECNRNRRITR